MRAYRITAVAAAALALAALCFSGVALAQKPTIMKGCMACHSAEPNVVRGKLVNHSPKFSSIQVDVGPVVWIINYDDKTDVAGKGKVADIPKGKEIAVTYAGEESKPLATRISTKPEFKIPEEQLVSVEEMKELVALGPEKGGYVLIDSRPPDAFNSGHIPGAVSLPYPKLAQMKEKALPADKNARIIFYCGGFS